MTKAKSFQRAARFALLSDPRLLDKVQAGDKIRFAATSEGGKYTVTGIQPAK